MGVFVTYDALTTDASGDGSQDADNKGILAGIDIVPVESASFDITISRVLPDGTLAPIYTEVGVTAVRSLGREDFTPNSIELAETVRVTLANAGEHTNPARVVLTLVQP